MMHTNHSLRSSDIVINGIRTRVRESGPGDQDEAIVFVHGNPGFSQDWDALMNYYGDSYRCVAPDMPGFGESDRPTQFDYRVEAYGSHLGQLIDHLGLRKVHLVLHDFGGPWGLFWAAGHAEKVASLTLINTGILPDYKWHAFARLWRIPLLGELSMQFEPGLKQGFSIMKKWGNPRGLPQNFIDTMYKHFDKGTRKAVLQLYRSTDPNRLSRAVMDSLGSRLTCPVQVLWGVSDPYIHYQFASKQKDCFPQAELNLIDGSGHWPFIDNPEKVKEIITPFFHKIVGREAIVT